MYIGLRTKRYGPTMTSRRGGSNGAGVPRPITMKVAMHQTATSVPAVPTTKPTTCAAPMFGGRTIPDHDRTRAGKNTRRKPTKSVAYVIVRTSTNAIVHPDGLGNSCCIIVERALHR